MKKSILLVASAALLLASCGKNEVFVPEQEDIPVGFSNYAPRAISKADDSAVDSGSLPTGAKIGVYGYSTADANLASGFSTKPEFMTDASVTYASTSATPTASTPVRYWPKLNTNLLSFFAYYPQESGKITNKPTAATEGMGSFTFTQAGTVDNMEDFMISNVANDMYYWAAGEAENANGVKAENGVVPLKFNHMLTKVNFKFRTVRDYKTENNITIKVKSAKIIADGSVYNDVVITPSYAAGAPGATGTTTFSRTSNTNKYDADIDIPFSGDLTLNTTPTLNNGTAKTQTDFLFVPQELTNDAKVFITYTIEQPNTPTEEVEATVQLNLINKDGSDPATPITEWHINEFITYTFNIGLREILFTGSANTWATVTNGTYVIQ